jgi:hypothetical protein
MFLFRELLIHVKNGERAAGLRFFDKVSIRLNFISNFLEISDNGCLRNSIIQFPI